MVARVLGLLSVLLSGLTLVRLRGKWAVLWGVKMMAGALTPFLALVGGLAALLGWVRRDRKAVGMGLLGAAVAVRHIVRVVAPHDGFARVFGPDWESRIPPDVRARMLPRRYTFRPEDPPPVPGQRDVVFGTHIETGDPLLCDLWLPPADAPHTGLAVIYLHGSAWHYLDKDMGTRRFFRHLAGQGHVVMDVAYTLAPKAQLKPMVSDVKRAIAWIKAHADEYRVNPERVVLVGGSAGGHLALLSAYTPNHPQLQPDDVGDADTSVRAVISYYGITDLRTSHAHFADEIELFSDEETRLSQWLAGEAERLCRRKRILPPDGILVNTPDFVSSLLGGTPDQVPDLCELGSPRSHVGPHCPPTLLLQGTHDTGGMWRDVICLHRTLDRAGVPVVYVEFPDTDHAFDLVFSRWSPVAQAATYDTERFLALMM